jgi:hypothetical protein
MQEQSKPAGSTGEEGGEKRVNVKAEAREPRASQAPGAPSESLFQGDDGSGDPEHSQPCQQGGLTMVRLAQEMKKDAAEQENLVSIIAELISETVQRNDSRNVRAALPPAPGVDDWHNLMTPCPTQRVSKLAPFEGGAAPIPAVAYVKRIKKYGGCSDCCFVAGLIYREPLTEHPHTHAIKFFACSHAPRVSGAYWRGAPRCVCQFHASKHHVHQGGGPLLCSPCPC